MINAINKSDFEKEEWPTPHLKNIIYDLLPTEYDVKKELINSVYHYSENNCEISSEIAEKFRPEIILQGINLKRERNSLSWGGMLYRVLRKKKTENDEYHKSIIQYLYIWTRQSSFYSFWLDVVPLWILMFLSIYINTDVQSYSPVFGNENPQVVFVDSADRMVMIALISIGLIFLSLLTTLLRKKFYIHSTLHFLYALIFSGQILELGASIDPSISLEWSFSFPLIVIESHLLTNIFWSPLILFLLSMIFLILLYFQVPLPLIRSQHTMDYAPLFVYLKSTDGNNWNLDYILYDNVHYFVKKKTAMELKKLGLLSTGSQGYKETPMIIINTSWHSMIISKFFWWITNNNTIKWLIKVTFWFGLFVLLGTTIFPDILIDIEKQMVSTEDMPLVQLLIRVLLVLFVILPLTFAAIFEKTTLYDRENLQKSNYYLSDTKLLTLWNLKSPKRESSRRIQSSSKKIREARLKIIEKLQDPFNNEDEIDDFWETFYDMDFQKTNFVVKILRLINGQKGSPHKK